jgi:hypothetical protein
MTDVVLPYNGTSGWSGSDTSRARAEYLDGSGITSKRQKEAMRLLAMSGKRGVIVHEFSEYIDAHHGSGSGVLSNLHLARRIARLKEKRDGCEVYVLPAFIDGRETVPHKRHKEVSEHG